MSISLEYYYYNYSFIWKLNNKKEEEKLSISTKKKDSSFIYINGLFSWSLKYQLLLLVF
jgi:hypothetical protein